MNSFQSRVKFHTDAQSVYKAISTQKKLELDQTACVHLPLTLMRTIKWS